MNYLLERCVDKLQVSDKTVQIAWTSTMREEPGCLHWDFSKVFPQTQHTQAPRAVVHGGKAAPLNGGPASVLLVLEAWKTQKEGMAEGS